MGGGGVKRRPAHKADLTAICEPIVYKMWEPRRLTTLWASTACYRDSFTFFFYIFYVHSCGKYIQSCSICAQLLYCPLSSDTTVVSLNAPKKY
jgi:hypothetical protein